MPFLILLGICHVLSVKKTLLNFLFIFHVPQKRATEQCNLLRLLCILFELYHFVIKHAFPLQMWLRAAKLFVVSAYLNIVSEVRTSTISKICMSFLQSRLKLEMNNLHVSECRQKCSEPAWPFLSRVNATYLCWQLHKSYLKEQLVGTGISAIRIEIIS